MQWCNGGAKRADGERARTEQRSGHEECDAAGTRGRAGTEDAGGEQRRGVWEGCGWSNGSSREEGSAHESFTSGQSEQPLRQAEACGGGEVRFLEPRWPSRRVLEKRKETRIAGMHRPSSRHPAGVQTAQAIGGRAVARRKGRAASAQRPHCEARDGALDAAVAVCRLGMEKTGG